MAVLKYKNSNGEYVAITNYEVQPLVPVSGTGQSMTDVMSQKAVTDELNKKANNVDLNGKIIDAISGDSNVQSAFNGQVVSAINNDDDVKGALDAKVADAIDNNDNVKDAIAEVLENSAAISGAINSVVAEAIASDSAVTEAVNEAVAEAISNASAVTEAVETVVNTKLVDYETAEVAEGKYALKNHTHEASAITDFNSAVASSFSGETVSGAINTAVANAVNESEEVKNAISEAVENSPAIASAISESVSDTIAEEMGGETGTTIVKSIETVIEKYIYGESTPSASATVVTTDNLATTLDAYAKIGDSISEFTNDANYVTSGQVDGIVAEAISGNETVISAITEIITSDSGITEAINAAVEDQLDEAVSGKADSDSVFASADYDSNEKKINFKNAAGTVIDYIDASDFIKDGMVDNVEISGGSLVITFNTDAGKEAIAISLTDIFDPNNYYDKTAVDGIVSGVNDSIDTKLDASAYTPTDLSQYWTSAQTEAAINESVSGKSDINHTHEASAITDFTTVVETIVSTSSTISGSIATIIADSIEDNPTVSGAIETAVESNSVVTASKSFTDFCSGHNTVSTLANIPTDKRLVIATISGSTNELSLSGNTLTDGYEIHVIVTNSGEEAATVTLPGSGGYITVGDAIGIEAGATGEINIISDGTNKYVRGV